MKNTTRILITVLLAVGLSTTVNYYTKNNDVLKDMKCTSKVMKASPSIVTICEFGTEAKHFITPINKEL